MKILEDIQNLTKIYEKYNSLETFVPHGGQVKVIKFFDKGVKVILTMCANGWGKTTFLANLMGNLIWANSGEKLCSIFQKNPMFQKWPYPKRIRIGTIPTNIKEDGSFFEEIDKWWPKDKYEKLKKGKDFYSYFRANGWIVDVVSYEQDVEEFDTGTIGMIIFDHPPRKEFFDAAIARTRKGGIVVICICPLQGCQWIISDIFDKTDGEAIKSRIGDISENCKQHGENGVLEHEHIQQMIAQWDPAEVEARAHGKPLHLVGRVYDIFDRDVHLYSKLPVERDKLTYYFFLDPHDRRPPAMIWVGVAKDGTIFGIAELPVGDFHKIKSSSRTIEDEAMLIKQREKDLRIKVCMRYLDPHWFNKQYPNSRLSVAEEYRQHGIKFRQMQSFKEMKTGVFESTSRKKVKDLLYYDKEREISNDNRPHLFIEKNMRNTIHSFYHYVWDEMRGKRADRMDISERPQKKNKCFPNLYEYMAMADIQWRDVNTNYANRQFPQFQEMGG